MTEEEKKIMLSVVETVMYNSIANECVRTETTVETIDCIINCLEGIKGMLMHYRSKVESDCRTQNANTEETFSNLTKIIEGEE